MFWVCFLLGCKRVVENEGMPFYRNPFTKGNLIMKFNVKFPENNFASSEQLKVSSTLLTVGYFSNNNSKDL